MSPEEAEAGAAGTPRWVKLQGLLLLVLLLVAAVAILSGHGPGVHAP